MRAHVLLLAILAAGAAPAALGAAVACAPALACPDLVVDARDAGQARVEEARFSPTHCAVVEGLVEAGERALLRFPLTTANVGAADLVVGRPEDRPDLFTASACHGHAHLDGFAAYRLWTAEAFAAWTFARASAPERPASDVLAERPDLAAGLVAGRKQGFCLYDAAPVGAPLGAPRFPTCGYQGISAGWRDRYDATLDGQWIDVTGVAPGEYVLEVETNPERVLEESDPTNNAFAGPVYVG